MSKKQILILVIETYITILCCNEAYTYHTRRSLGRNVLRSPDTRSTDFPRSNPFTDVRLPIRRRRRTCLLFGVQSRDRIAIAALVHEVSPSSIPPVIEPCACHAVFIYLFFFRFSLMVHRRRPVVRRRLPSSHLDRSRACLKSGGRL